MIRRLAGSLLALGLAGTVQAQDVAVTFNLPFDGTVFTAPATFNVSAYAADAKNVKFYANGVLVASDLFAPFEKQITLTEPDTYTLTVVALDVNDLTTTAQDEITVIVNARPTATIASPTSGSSAMAATPVTITADADDEDGTVASVKFYVDGALIGTATAAPYTATYSNPVVGTHTLTAVATDNYGATGTSTASTLTVTPATALPTLTITSPTVGTAVTGPRNVTISATASDSDGTIASVAFYANNVLLGTDTAAYLANQYSGVFPAVTSGSYTLKVVATDNLGAQTTRTVGITVTAPTGNTVTATRTYAYNAQQQLCRVMEPESGSTVTGYDLAGNVAWTTTGQALPVDATCHDTDAAVLAARSTRTYDTLNRLKKIDVAGSSNDPTYEYYDDGVLRKLTNGTAVWDYTYNLRRLPVSETLSYGGLVRTLTHAYNANGFEASLAYPSGLLVQFAPNARGQATQAGSSFATQVTYHANGGMASFKYNACTGGVGGPCITHSMAQNARGLPAQVTDSNVAAGGTVTPIKDTYAYDATGNVLSITDTSTGSFGRTRDQMKYDGLGRLLSTRAQGQSWASATTSYDALDNIRKNVVGSRTWTYNYDANNRLSTVLKPTSTAITYDANGNVTGHGTAGYVYDAANRMLQATNKETYAYDGHGRRVEMKRASDAKSSYPFYSLAGQLIADHDTRLATATATEYVYLNGSLVVKRSNTIGQVNYSSKMVYTDALGSPIAESTSGATITRVENYTPFGEVTDGVYDQGPGFTSHTTDAATGLSYMQQRYYDPMLGRFLSVDPVAASSAEFGRYAYAGNNPYKFKDPDGRYKKQVAEQIGDSVGGCTWAGVRGSTCDGRRSDIGNYDPRNPIPSLAAPKGTRSDGQSRAPKRDGYWKRVWENVKLTNTAPGDVVRTGAGLAMAGTTAKTIGVPTLWEAGVGSVQAGFVTTEVLPAAAGAAVNTAYTAIAFEAGALVGSMINQASLRPGGTTLEEALIPITENNVNFFKDLGNKLKSE